MAESNVTVSKGKKSFLKSKTAKVLSIVLVLVVVFGVGVAAGWQWKTKDYEQNFFATVGETPAQTEPYSLELFGTTLQYNGGENEEAQEKTLLESVTLQDLKNAETEDVIQLYIIAVNREEKAIQEQIATVLKQNVSKLTSEEKQRAEALGVEF